MYGWMAEYDPKVNYLLNKKKTNQYVEII